MSAARLIARNAGAQVAAEILSKLASLALYVVMARHLGKNGFGDFTFALSLALLLTAFAGFGTENILTREVARDREEVHRLFWNAIAIKLAFGALALVVGVVVSFAGHYNGRIRAAVAILTVGALVDVLTKTVYATFLGFEDTRPTALSLLLQRYTTAIVGIALLLLGVGVVPVALVYLAGALVAAVFAATVLARRMTRPRIELSLERAKRFAIASMPIGIAGIFTTVLFRVDATLLSFLTDNTQVGLYSAAYRVLESTLFLTYVFTWTTLPALSRLRRDTTPPIAQAYEGALKVILVMLLPVGTGLLLFADTLIDGLYGRPYAEAASAVRLLGGAAALYGVTYLSTYLLVGQDRQRIVPWVTGGLALGNIALNLVLIPSFGFDGAAAATSITEAAGALLMTVFALRATGRVSLRRIATGPVVASAAMGAVAAALGGGVLGIVGAAVAYPVVLLLVERRLFPADLKLIGDSLRRRPAVA